MTHTRLAVCAEPVLARVCPAGFLTKVASHCACCFVGACSLCACTRAPQAQGHTHACRHGHEAPVDGQPVCPCFLGLVWDAFPLQIQPMSFISLSPGSHCLASVFDVVHEVTELDSKDPQHLALLARPELGITFTKLQAWTLTQWVAGPFFLFLFFLPSLKCRQ